MKRQGGCLYRFIEWLRCTKGLNDSPRTGGKIQVGWSDRSTLKKGKSVVCPDGKKKTIGAGYFNDGGHVVGGVYDKGHDQHVHVGFCGWRRWSARLSPQGGSPELYDQQGRRWHNDCCPIGGWEQGCEVRIAGFEITPAEEPADTVQPTPEEVGVI